MDLKVTVTKESITKHLTLILFLLAAALLAGALRQWWIGAGMPNGQGEVYGLRGLILLAGASVAFVAARIRSEANL